MSWRKAPAKAAHLDRHVVDVAEFVNLSDRGARHPGEFGVRPKEVLIAHARECDRLVLDGHTLLGLDGLMQTIRPAPARHRAAGELVDNYDLFVLDDVVDLALEEVLRLDGVEHEGRPLLTWVIQIGDLQDVLCSLIPVNHASLMSMPSTNVCWMRESKKSNFCLAMPANNWVKAPSDGQK